MIQYNRLPEVALLPPQALVGVGQELRACASAPPSKPPRDPGRSHSCLRRLRECPPPPAYGGPRGARERRIPARPESSDKSRVPLAHRGGRLSPRGTPPDT